ncbi:PhzF family phenazine biosynthesis protein [Azospirillum sp.]|uniref:PhzF family phenazine biosynthesis protein n=1 Tax=Azospirillum sp. TaxID=34012 RepID=UPI002D3BB5CD|nr:PhzF family phenazine biosynthesis protein [Azospirillum sp.]HYD65813.1 PhzF family phenazine biosynthesis protein [Azospirillum sp.]
MRLPIYQVDAFTDAVFGGNPAAVVPLESWLPDERLQAIAAENNLAETAFLVPAGGDYAIRWFTPTVEVDLCGHATLAAAHVITTAMEPGRERIDFRTRQAGRLTVERQGDLLVLDFPSRPATRTDVHPDLVTALGGGQPEEVLAARDVLVVYRDADVVRSLTPDLLRLGTVDDRAVCVTAPGADGVDFVSRFFAPTMGIPEDPVTGSAHCTLIPYWAARLGRTKLTARQVSARGGALTCEVRGDRVKIGGKAVLYLEGFIHV